MVSARSAINLLYFLSISGNYWGLYRKTLILDGMRQ